MYYVYSHVNEAMFEWAYFNLRRNYSEQNIAFLTNDHEIIKATGPI